MSVAIVGSGPAGLALAFILDGNVPYYDPDRYGPHPDPRLHEMLVECPNLLEAVLNPQILDYVKASVLSFFSSDCSPASLLIDTLQIPSEANLQSLDTMESRIMWKYEPQRRIPYTIYSSSGAGGQWTDMSADSASSRVLSYAEMLSLPKWAFSDFYVSKYSPPPEFFRPHRGAVAEYYQEYAAKMNLHIQDHEVTHVKKAGNQFILFNGDNVIGEATDVVLASGVSSAPTQSMETKLLGSSGAVIVVGSGVSAADAVIEAKPHQVLHIYKWMSPTGEPTPLRKYPKKLYPEYVAVFEKMKKGTGATYLGVPNGEIVNIDGHKVKIRKQDGETLEVEAQKLVIRTGRAGSIEYAREILPTVPELVSKTSLRELGLPLPSVGDHVWAVGSLAGDSLVRYVMGMCCATAGQLM